MTVTNTTPGISTITLSTLLRRWVVRQADSETEWVESQLNTLRQGASETTLHRFLGLAPRRLGREDLRLSVSDLKEAEQLRPDWDPKGWSLDGTARIAGLLAFQGPRPFPALFKDLVRTSDARELITLYRGLPLYPEPLVLTHEVGEGLRSNMRAVFESIAHFNPYPRDHFDDHRWNHMVLKALFVGSRLQPIVGLEQRANPELARILLDYAQERWAAGRDVSPELWHCVGPFAETVNAYEALSRALDGSPAERSAATLALVAADTSTARSLLADAPDTLQLVAAGRIDWNHLTQEEAA
ncbi:EboA domain-containing protein [Salinicola rhizosphaerae]|uniref:Uncharacterized protein n=1 Tax=Salinicola rhizosphaerae TaxID=1443141 RepID=A0ABQ3E7D8_9GAMM|nr:EboA domain-containing protein [Salinicola rhizosphaerae]GHB25631.1 hypothetical protein GCM10009038_25920 [Salinicola rhizosphaerae]